MKVFIAFLFVILVLGSVSASEYQVKRASELSVGDVIIASDGSEIVVQEIEFNGGKDFYVEKSKSLMDVIWEKIPGQSPSLTGRVVSGGSSENGLSLGFMGTAVVISEDYVPDFVESPSRVEKKSFWNKLIFWRRR